MKFEDKDALNMAIGYALTKGEMPKPKYMALVIELYAEFSKALKNKSPVDILSGGEHKPFHIPDGTI